MSCKLPAFNEDSKSYSKLANKLLDLQSSIKDKISAANDGISEIALEITQKREKLRKETDPKKIIALEEQIISLQDEKKVLKEKTKKLSAKIKNKNVVEKLSSFANNISNTQSNIISLVTNTKSKSFKILNEKLENMSFSVKNSTISKNAAKLTGKVTNLIGTFKPNLNGILTQPRFPSIDEQLLKTSKRLQKLNTYINDKIGIALSIELPPFIKKTTSKINSKLSSIKGKITPKLPKSIKKIKRPKLPACPFDSF